MAGVSAVILGGEGAGWAVSWPAATAPEAHYIETEYRRLAEAWCSAD
jgi:hypothetical protein